MKKFNNILLPAGALALFAVFSFVGEVHAATAPNLGAADSFSILGQTLITGISTISGDVGSNNVTGGVSITALTTTNVGGTIYATDLAAPSEAIIAGAVQTDASAAFTTNIPGQATNGTIVGNLDGQTFVPGVYDQGAILLAGGTVTLDGAGVYIFRSASSLTSAGTINLINGARACDVYWRVQTSADINGSSFLGTILAGTGVHFGPGVTLNGRALAVGADVTLGVGGTISGPTCASGGGGGGGGGGGVPRPRIHVEKEPTPSELPNGPDIVMYDYTVTNLGKSSMNNIKVSDDVCSNVEFVSGDIDEDEKLDTDETWAYQCSMTLTRTTTNIVTATGESLAGREAKDTDEATVVVRLPRVPPPPVVAAIITTPLFPNAGVAPREVNTFPYASALVGLLALLLLSRKQRLLSKTPESK